MAICGGGLPPRYAVRRQHASVQVDHLVGGLVVVVVVVDASAQVDDKHLGGGLVVVVVDQDHHNGKEK